VGQAITVITKKSCPFGLRVDEQANVTDLLVERYLTSPRSVLFSVRAAGSSEWRPIRVSRFFEEVVDLAKGFVALGVQPGDRIGLICDTRYEWTLIDFAAWFAGAILVPLYKASTDDQKIWELSQTRPAILILESLSDGYFCEVSTDLPSVGHVLCIERGDLSSLVDSAHAITDEEVERRRTSAIGSDPATIIYTSGTTGHPKGCVITHANLLYACCTSAEAVEELLTHGASTLIFTALTGVFARFISVFCVWKGIRVGHEPRTSEIAASLSSFQPTFILGVPSLFERLYNEAMQRAISARKEDIFEAAMKVATQYSQYSARNRRPSILLKLKHAFFELFIYRRIRKALGGKVAYAISGAAPLGVHLASVFDGVGIRIFEGYGMTEATAVISINTSDAYRAGTVGRPLEGTEIRLADDGEIQIAGAGVFSGYWNDDIRTAAILEGRWLMTGDLGRLNDGYLTITGRKKELLVTSGGANVPPTVFEDALRSHPLVDQAMVVGDGRPYITALVTLDSRLLPLWLRNHGICPLSLSEAAVHPTVVAAISQAVDEANHLLSRLVAIRKFRILDTEFTELGGQLTAKYTLRRANILTQYADAIDAMY